MTLSAVPAAAQVKGFGVVNHAGGAMSGMAVRRVGTSQWVPIEAAAAVGASARANFEDQDCAFDIRATVAGVGQMIWTGVNLCDVKSVTLNRDAAGRLWIDYD